MSSLRWIVIAFALVSLSCDRKQSAAPTVVTHDQLIWKGDIPTREVAIEELQAPSGKIIACDAFVLGEDEQAFTVSVAPGKYPVILTVARHDDDERIAYATVRFSASPPVRWEMAVGPEQLKPGQEFYFAVDSGTACFMDLAALAAINRKMDQDDKHLEKVSAAMEQHHNTTWDWASVALTDLAANQVIFSSGFGDGGYSSYFGRDASGKIVCLVTDFDVLEDSKDPWAKIPEPAK